MNSGKCFPPILSLCWIFEKSFNSSNIQVNLTLNYYGLNEKLGFSNALFSPGRINSKRLKEFVLLSKTYFVMFPKPFTLSLLRVRVLRNSQNYVKVLAKPQSYRFLELYLVSVSKDKNTRSREIKKENLFHHSQAPAVESWMHFFRERATTHIVAFS